MKIDFYEEFPDEENLKKLKLITFKTRLFIASKSLKEFKNLESRVRKINRKVECAYWPVVKNSYYISPFSNPPDLKELFKELDKCNNHLLIDLEMPLNKKLILKNIFNFSRNNGIIKKFMEEHKERIVTAQPIETIFSKYIRIRGQDFNVQTEKSLMWYSSMIPEMINKSIKNHMKNLKNKSQYSVSLGAIAHGVMGNEPILSPGNLEKDMEFVEKSGFDRAIIFRLGGLNKEYVKVLDKFV